MRLIEERRGSAVTSYVYEPDSYVPLARLDAEGERTEQGGLGTTQDVQQPQTSKTIAANAGQSSARGQKQALFRFGWNATFPTRAMVRPLLFAKDFQAGE